MKIKQLLEAKYYQENDFEEVILNLGALITDYTHAGMHDQLEREIGKELMKFDLSDKDLTEIILHHADAGNGWSKSDLYTIQTAAQQVGRSVLPDRAIDSSDLPDESDEDWMF